MKILSYLTLALAAALPLLADNSDSVITPEPGTVGLLVIGIAGMGIAAWRRNRNQ